MTLLPCMIHGVKEDDENAYWACMECWHVWRTQADFQHDVEALIQELNAAPDSWGKPDEPMVAPEYAEPNVNIWCCPHCTHDW